MQCKLRIIGMGVVLAGVLALAGCSDDPISGNSERLQAQIQELNQQVRQYRAEVQRSNEKIVAMLQAHGLQSDNPSGVQSAADPHAGHGGAASMRSAATSTPSSPSMSGSAVSHALHQSHATMDKEMAGVPMSGDPDRDFLAMMIPHHQGAIDMARIIIAGGKRPDVRKFAEEIIAHQQAEIDLMNRWLQAPPQ